MNNELLQICDMYKSICAATQNRTPSGMSVKELRNTYKLKKRDLIVLLEFINEQISIVSSNHLNFDIVNYEENRRIKLSNINDLKNTDYILIYDIYNIASEKLDEEDFNLLNETFVNEIDKLKESTNLTKISKLDIKNIYYINKSAHNLESNSQLSKNKIAWINATLKKRIIEITYKTSKNNAAAKVLPLGFYYNYFSDDYHCIFESSNSIKELDLQDIIKINILEKKFDKSFDINDYLKQSRTQKLVLKVYSEGNVINKLTRQLSGHEVSIEEYDTYSIFTIITDDCWQYEKVIKSYGRSVIVLAPDYLRQIILDEATETLNFYKNM